jgi:hypothetical protein
MSEPITFPGRYWTQDDREKDRWVSLAFGAIGVAGNDPDAQKLFLSQMLESQSNRISSGLAWSLQGGAGGGSAGSGSGAGRFRARAGGDRSPTCGETILARRPRHPFAGARLRAVCGGRYWAAAGVETRSTASPGAPLLHAVIMPGSTPEYLIAAAHLQVYSGQR